MFDLFSHDIHIFSINDCLYHLSVKFRSRIPSISAPGLADKHYAYDDARACSLLPLKRRKWLKSLNVLTDVGTFKNASSYSLIALPL